MAYSYVVYTGNGSTTQFAITFPYIRKEHVKVYVNYVDTAYTYVNDTTVQLAAAPASPLRVEVRRVTPLANVLVDYTDGSTLVAADLDTSNLQSLYNEQELDDNQKRGIFVDDATGLITAGGQRITNVANPVNAQDAATKTYVDTADALKVAKAGDSMTGALAMGTNKITGLGNPTSAQDGATKTYVDTADALKVAKAGDTMSGALAMGTNKITGMGDPTSAQDAATKTYVDTADALKVAKAGDTMSGALAMGSNKITGLGTPTANADAATKLYVDTVTLAGNVPDGDRGDITVSGVGTSWAIDAGAVVEAKLGTGAVTETKLGAGAVTETKLGAGAVVEAKLGTGAVTETKLGTGAVTSTKILDGTILDADVNATAGIVASKLSFTQAGTGAVARTVDSKLEDVVSVKDFGATGNNSTDDTAAIQAAINAADAQGSSYGIDAFQGPPLRSVAIGTQPVVYFPKGTYRISSALTYGSYTKFSGEAAIIYQTNPANDIFYSTSIYQNEWSGLVLIGGRTQIHAQNGVSSGIEGALIKIRSCEFQASANYAIKFVKPIGAGGEQGIVKDSRFFNCSQDLYTRFDFCSVKDCWLEKDDTQATPNQAWINAGQLIFADNALIPGGNFGSGTVRYVDNYGSVALERNRFGSEGGGGMPIVYNFTNALTSGAVYPYMDGGSVVIANNVSLATGNAARTDEAIIVLKSGIPKLIAIENNGFGFDSPCIRTNLLTSGASFSTYFAGYQAEQPMLSIRIKNNTKWAGIITDSTSSTHILRNWLDCDLSVPTRKILSLPPIEGIQGVYFPLTSTSGATGITDTGITPASLIYSDVGKTTVFLVHMEGNPNLGGNGNYRLSFTGLLTFWSDYTYALSPAQPSNRIELTTLAAPADIIGPLTFSAVFWDGTTERNVCPYGSTINQIRFKVGGYGGTTGAYQIVRVMKIAGLMPMT